MESNDGAKLGAFLFAGGAVFFGSKALHASDLLAFFLAAVVALLVLWWAYR